MSRRAEHMEVCEGLMRLPRETTTLWDRLEKSTKHPLHRKRASELFLEVLALQNDGTEIDWPSIYCAITTLTRLDKDCLQARLAVGCSELEFRWMLHDRHLYTVHKVPVRFQRCLACMVAKQGPCGDHKATWLCRSRLTDAPPGAHVQNAHCLRPSRQRAYQMTDPHNKKSSSSGPGQQHSELISMYDSHTWPETRRSETFHSQASKLWEFVTEELQVEDPVELWSVVSRACSKRYLLMMAKLWHRASVPEDRLAMDSFVLHAPQDLPQQPLPAADNVLAGQPIQEREGREGSWMYPTHPMLAQLRAELDLDDSGEEGSGSCEDRRYRYRYRYRRPWHWLPQMSGHPKWCKMVLPKPLKAKRGAQDSLDSLTPLLSQELSRHGRKRRLTSAMTDMLQGNSSQTGQSGDDLPYERRTPSKASPHKARAPSKRVRTQKAAEQLGRQLRAEGSALPDQEGSATAAVAAQAAAQYTQHAQHDQQAESLMSPSTEDWHSTRHLSHVGSSNTLSPSASTNLSHFGSSDYCMSPGCQLTSPIASGLSSNSTTTSLGLSYIGSTNQPLALRPYHEGSACPSQSWGPNPMLGLDWLPQTSNLAAQLGHIRTERPRLSAMAADVSERLWGFDEFPPVPGNFEGNLDNLGLSLDFNARASHGVQAQHAEPGHSSLWPTCPQLLATSNALPGAVTSGVAHFLGMA